MYVHAYQSYLWNAATSERCLKHGTKTVVQGDLVLPDDSPEAEEEHHANGEQVLPPFVQRHCVHCTQAAARLRHACGILIRCMICDLCTFHVRLVKRKMADLS